MPDPFKLNVLEQLFTANNVDGGYIPLKQGPAPKEGDEDKRKNLTFRFIAFQALSKYKPPLDRDGRDTETIEQLYDRHFLARRIHECQGEIELEEPDRQLIKTAIAETYGRQEGSGGIAFDCMCILRGKPQSGKVLESA